MSKWLGCCLFVVVFFSHIKVIFLFILLTFVCGVLIRFAHLHSDLSVCALS